MDNFIDEKSKLVINKRDQIYLFKFKSICCGCGACVNACLKQAISMKEDEHGFLYPQIDHSFCIKCRACKKVCAYQNVKEENVPIKTFVSAMKDEGKLLNSASGGVFAALAKSVLSDGGIVFGASIEYVDGNLMPMHIAISNLKDLSKLQGSKYVQSLIGTTYSEAKKYLLNNNQVLFSGTPCQIAGLKSFLEKDYKNLLTIDIICHGVPSASFFQGYLQSLEKSLKGKILNFKFRDKTNGWGLVGKVTYQRNDGKIEEKIIPWWYSSYYSMFLNSSIYRENCYYCKYANLHRPGDITIGDYWGIEREHPELMEENGGVFSKEKGISCIIVNTDKGNRYIEMSKFELNLYPSTFEKAAQQNSQLNHPSQMNENRDEILELYTLQGYDAIEQYFKKTNGKKIMWYRIKSIIPKSLKIRLNRMFHK